jgi:hypothetical protein
MKYAVAALLGLVAVQARKAEPVTDSAVATTYNPFGAFWITQTYDWDIDYGTYFNDAADTSYVYQYYGTYVEAWAECEYTIWYGSDYEVAVFFTLTPFYYVPVETEVDIIRAIYNQTQPGFVLNMNTWYEVLYLTTQYYDNVGITTVSLRDYLDNVGPIYPGSGTWGLSSADTITDPVWTVSLYDWVNDNLANGNLPLQGEYVNTYYTHTYTL